MIRLAPAGAGFSSEFDPVDQPVLDGYYGHNGPRGCLYYGGDVRGSILQCWGGELFPDSCMTIRALRGPKSLARDRTAPQ